MKGNGKLTADYAAIRASRERTPRKLSIIPRHFLIASSIKFKSSAITISPGHSLIVESIYFLLVKSPATRSPVVHDCVCRCYEDPKMRGAPLPDIAQTGDGLVSLSGGGAAPITGAPAAHCFHIHTSQSLEDCAA